MFAFIGMPGPFELCIIAGIGLLLFGNRLPRVMRSVGSSITEFKKGVQGIEDDIDETARAINAPPLKNEKEVPSNDTSKLPRES